MRRLRWVFAVTCFVAAFACAHRPVEVRPVRHAAEGEVVEIAGARGLIVRAEVAERATYRRGEYWMPTLEVVAELERALKDALQAAPRSGDRSCGRGPGAAEMARTFRHYFVGVVRDGRRQVDVVLIAPWVATPERWVAMGGELAGVAVLDGGLWKAELTWNVEEERFVRTQLHHGGCAMRLRVLEEMSAAREPRPADKATGKFGVRRPPGPRSPRS